MQVNEQAVEAAAKAIADSIGHGMSEKCFDHARAALTAAAPYMSSSSREQALEEAEHAVGSTVLKHRPSDYSGLSNFEAYEAGQLNGLERAQASLRALKSQPVTDGWLPISEAKRDGTEYYTWNGRKQHVSRFDKVDNLWVSTFQTVTKRLPLSPQPTHWRPLPPAPQTGGGE